MDIDLSLAVLFALAAAFAGAVGMITLQPHVGWQRAVLGGVAVAVATGGTFALLIALAHVSMIVLYAAVAVFAGAVTFLTLRRDLGRTAGTWTAVLGALLVTASFVVVAYFALFSFIGALGVYLVLRRRLRIKPALIAMATTLGGLIAASVAVFAIALASM